MMVTGCANRAYGCVRVTVGDSAYCADCQPVCGHPGSNHSSDLIEVWSGRPTPRYVCGFHQSQELLD